MSTAPVRTGIDAWVSTTDPDLNHSAGKWLRVKATDEYSFLYFKSPAPRGATILSAHLHLFGVGASGDSYTVSVQRVAAKWAETQINYNNKPGVTGSVASVTATQSADGQDWSFDVAPLLSTIAAGAANYGFRISTSDASLRKFYSLNAGDNQPYMRVTWVLPPDAPTELTPSGGSAVSVAKPVLTFNYHDVDGDEQMQAVQVQINPTNDFTAPAFDSGTVATTDPELDLSGTGYAGISDGGTAWWRVRVQNTSSVWSDWSDHVSFTRVNKMSVTIDSPAASPNDFVEDPTPELSWTVTPGPQTGRWVIITDEADPTHPLYDSGLELTSSTSFTPPLYNGDKRGVINDEDATYRLTLRIFENNTRTATPGDDVFIEVSRTFTFQEDPTPDPVTSLAAAQVANGKPHVRLTWDRATAPDGFTISRNDKVVEHNLDPADLFVSGTTYAYVDVTAEPHTLHTWKVRPRVNGKVGPNRTVSLRYITDEVWLTSVDDTTKLVPIVGTADDKSQITYDMPEIGALFQPVNGDAPRGVTQAQYGLTGHMVGRLTNRNGLDAQDWVDNLFWIKARPENVYRLTIGEQNLRVHVRNVVIAPPGGPGSGSGSRAISFDFYSLDGPVRV